MDLTRKFKKIIQILSKLLCIYSTLNICLAQQMEFSPDQMIFKGDVVTKNNSIGACTNDWLTNTPESSIILGVNPISCNPQDWRGVTASLHFNVKNQSFPIMCVIRISWPDRDGKGLHSPYKGKNAIIQFDGQTIWSKRTEIQSKYNNDSYAAEHEPIQTTVVIKDAGPHTFTFIVPEKTAWDISNIELLFFDYPKNIKGIGYSPYRDCQYPGGNEQQQPTVEEVKEDLFRLSHTCNTIRTYSSTGINGKVPAIAKSLGLKVFAGAWVDGDFDNPKNDAKEIKALINIANTIDIDGVIVGNEYYFRHKSEPEAINYLLNCITQVKEGLKKSNIPILTAEILSFANNSNYLPIINKIDELLIHIYPFWDAYWNHIRGIQSNISIDNSAKFTTETILEFQKKLKREFPDQNKSVIIGEAGWPSQGQQEGEAIPSFKFQRKYLQEFLYLADQKNIDFMYFDAFNELWKTEEGLLGQHWGYSYSDRTAKYNFYGVLIPPYLVPENNIDLPPTTPFSEEAPNIYKILFEWPRSKESFKITNESIKRIRKHNISNNRLNEFKKFLNKEFIDQATFLNSVTSELKNADVELKKKERNTNNENNQGYSSGENKSKIEKLILKYSKYHYFFPRYMGDYDKITMYECDRCNPASGEMSARITFSFDGEKKWCGIYWLPMYDFESEENEKNEAIRWEDLPGVNIYEKMKIDKSLPVVLTFSVRGKEGGEKVQFKVEGVKKNTRPVETEWLTLDKEWKQYIIDLSDIDLSNVIGGFCCVSSWDKNPGKEKIQFYLDDIQYELKTENTLEIINKKSNILESDFHLLQFFGDISSRSTNFFESNYNGRVFSGETRFIFPRFSGFLDFVIPIPEPFFSGTLKSLKKIDWEDRFDFGIGLEWRPFSKMDILEKPLLRWIKQMRFYTLFLSTVYLQYQNTWSWRPKTDFRYGMEFYEEYNLYNTNMFWTELWADASWRKTNFFVKDYNSWTLAIVPKVGIKIFQGIEFCIMPYLTGEFALTQRYEFWQNRMLAGIGIRFMPFRWNESMMNVFIKGLRLYIENLWVLNYFDDNAPASIPDYDLRAGINYTINWW